MNGASFFYRICIFGQAVAYHHFQLASTEILSDIFFSFILVILSFVARLEISHIFRVIFRHRHHTVAENDFDFDLPLVAQRIFVDLWLFIRFWRNFRTTRSFIYRKMLLL